MGQHAGFPGEAAGDRESDLRRRLAFYEGFDAIINENVRRSGELLREAEHRHAASRAAAEATRDGQRALLIGLRDEAAALARLAQSLAGRIDAALVELVDTAELPLAVTQASAQEAVPVSQPALDQPPTIEGRPSLELVVHGIPDLAAAQMLRRALESSSSIETVSVREYAGGMMRLALEPREILAPDRLRTLGAPFTLEEIDRGPGVIAVRIITEQP